jgi:hypothetical protein
MEVSFIVIDIISHFKRSINMEGVSEQGLSLAFGDVGEHDSTVGKPA